MRVPQPLGAGSEIDAWCTKCKMDLGHRIIAMVGTVPKRVECQTCFSHHNYRPPKTTTKTSSRKRPAPAASPPAERTTARAKAEVERTKEWEKRVLGQAATAFSRFSVSKTYALEQLVVHKKFGEGYVVELLEGDKLSIMFRDGPRMLVHGKKT